MSDWKVYPRIEPDRLMRFTSFVVVKEEGDGRVVVHQPSGILREFRAEAAIAPEEVPGDWWQLHNEALGPLHDFLGLRLGHISEASAIRYLRQDYEAERERVDGLIAALTDNLSNPHEWRRR